uniref:Uncharacterized protein n=1 Tax=Ditylum brightwellii TaxID=49249 RepID=A0A7S4QSF2_9STRA|mmetsp:Transcript_33525/g.44744  ORF Transcript_33525/g.44744 Transcript_33525/m.44744 type:complete len:332 (-) Transcript_33525:32-1027(-)
MMGDEFETSTMSTIGSNKQLVSDVVGVPTIIETSGSRKQNLFSACPSVCSCSCSESSRTSRGGANRKSQYMRHRTLEKELIAHLRAELGQTKAELESNQALVKKLLEENQELRTKTNSVNAQANDLLEEAERVSLPQGVQKPKSKKLCGSLGPIQRLQFEVRSTDNVAQATASRRDADEDAKNDKTLAKETMIDIDLADDFSSVNTMSSRSRAGQHKLLERKNNHARTVGSSTLNQDESNLRRSSRALMTIEVPSEEENARSLRGMVRASFRSSFGGKEKKLVSPDELLWDNNPLGLGGNQGMKERDSLTSSRNSFWSFASSVLQEEIINQ